MDEGATMPLTGDPSKDIPELKRSGRPQKQAVAIALKEEREHKQDEIMQPTPDMLMNLETARKIGMAFFHAGKSQNDLLSYFGNDYHDPNCRQALGMFEQMHKRYDDDRSSEERRSRSDDRSSEEHEEEANRLEALAEKEKDPKVKAKLENKATFHREEVGLDSVSPTRLRFDSDERQYAFEKLTSSLAELKSRADKVFRKAADDDCDDDEEAADAGTGRTVR